MRTLSNSLFVIAIIVVFFGMFIIKQHDKTFIVSGLGCFAIASIIRAVFLRKRF